MAKMVNFGDFKKKTEVYGRTVLPDMSPLMGQKLLKYAQIQKLKCVILSGQKFIKNTKNGPFMAIFRKPESCGQTVLPDG